MRLKKLGIWFLAIFLFATHVWVRSASADEPSHSWKQMTSRSKDCQIAFPSQPQVIQRALKVSEEGHMLTYDIYLAPLHRDALCLLLVATYPAPMTQGNAVAGLEGLLNGILGHNPESKMTFAKVIDLKGNPAVDFLIQSPTSYFRGQALMVGSKLFLIALEGRADQFEEKVFTRFAETFSLLP